jgi:antitoxin component YwqK of YwqJK toxin-antitoxin module
LNIYRSIWPKVATLGSKTSKGIGGNRLYYTSCSKDWIVVMTGSRDNISDISGFEHGICRACKMTVKKIYNKFNPQWTIKEITNHRDNSSTSDKHKPFTYKVGKNVRCYTEYNIGTYGIIMYKYEEQAFHDELEKVENGELKKWDHDGRLRESITFRDGLRHGKRCEYYGSDHIRSMREYYKGKIHGLQIVYNIQGKIERRTSYKNDYMHGIDVEYYAYHDIRDSSIRATTEWMNGKRCGQSASYYRNGNKRSECTYVDDMKDGISQEWNRDLVLRVRNIYERNELNGFEFKWDDKRKLTYIYMYENGNINNDYTMVMVDGKVDKFMDFDISVFQKLYQIHHEQKEERIRNQPPMEICI